MSSKDKSLKETFTNIFKRGKTGHLAGRTECICLNEETLKNLGKESSIPTRVKVLKDLCSRVSDSRLENHAVEKLWRAIEDLFSREHSTETRHLAFQFLQCLIKGQNDKLEITRAHFFRFIKLHDNPEDVIQRLELFNTLTSNGKNILYFEEEVGLFLLNWLPDIVRAGKIDDYLATVDNVIKFNAAYLDDEVMTGLIQYICELCSIQCKTVLSCLQIMSSVVAYSNMSPDSLPKFIEALCRTVIQEEYCLSSWNIMKTLLGTHMGHSALYTMCQIVQNPLLLADAHLIRGAVFFIHTSLWGNTPLPNLHCPPNSVLPSFLHAVKCNKPEVVYEIMLGLHHLVLRRGRDLQQPAWAVLLQIISHIINNIENSSQIPNKNIFIKLHETLTNIQNLEELGSFNGSIKQYYDVIEECAKDRPESSMLRLIMHLSHSIVPTEHLWLTNLYNLLNKYFKPNIRTNIRLKVLDVLSHVVKLNRRQYEEELIDRIVIPHMINISNCTDIVVRSSVANLLIDLCMDCESKKCLELLEILEKLLLRPFEMYPAENTTTNECDFSDTKCLVKGLIDVFVNKIYRLPSSYAIKIYKMLVSFLEMHYTIPKLFESCNIVRKMIFECFLKMRANSMYQLGYPINDKLKFSPYLGVTFGCTNRGSLGSPPPASPAPSQHPACTVSYVSLNKIFKIFIMCLKSEKDWEVLNLVLTEMTEVLQNKSLILSKQGNNELDVLVNVLCAMLTDKSLNLPESLNIKVSKPDFHTSVLLVLVNLASYHNYFDQKYQQKLIRCLIICTNTAGPRSSNSVKHCISALTICTLEMKEAMVKLLPDVLLNLSQKSATVHIAIPVLEFLSTLTQLPMVYSSFVADQYMALFAIALPYTNPFKYNHYIVSLAHHVIAVWFLKCRLSFRKDFVKFITDGLQTNVLVPFGEETRTIFANQNLSELNQDSSDRKRSSSLTEQGSRRQTATLSSVRMDKTLVQKPNAEKSLTMTFYEELTETCLDLMARYAFSPCSALPKRLPAAEFLLNGGQTMSWLVGNKLVTVTTSGCSQKVLKNGLCDKCWVHCSRQSESRQSKRGRSGSNETDDLGWSSRQNSNEKSNNNTSVSSPSEVEKKVGHKLEMVSSKLQQLANFPKQEVEACACWCSEWAEIYIRRPTGNMSWVMRIQNNVSFSNCIYEFPLNEISTLYMPSLYPENKNPLRPPLRRQSSEDHPAPEDEKTVSVSGGTVSSLPGSPKESPSRQNSRDSVDEECECVYDDGTKSRNPVRRSNSSPEMSASWKNPFLHQKVTDAEDNQTSEEDSGKKNKMYSKDMRVSCEAIPEEIAGLGTTPPSSEFVQQAKPTQQSITQLPDHPVLLSCHSYPGSSPPKDISPKLYKTVPPTPNINSSYQQPEFSRRPTNLPTLGNLGPLVLTSKPPQSPTQTSPRLPRHSIGHEIQKSSSSSILEKNTSNVNLNLARERARERKNSGSVERLSSFDPNQSQKRERVHTISVMQNNRKPRSEFTRPPTRAKEVPKSGINPSFVFLQLYHAASFGQKEEKPMLVHNAENVQRAVKILDTIPPYETHGIGVVYVREGQANSQVEILKNKFGSMRYVEFLQNLGTLVKLEDVDPQLFFLGGLDQHGGDGKFAYIWQDDVIKVMFHVATMMPNKESDPACNNKKMHIGNNYVTIVYNDSGEDYSITTIRSQFNFACIIIEPLDYNFNRVTVKVKDELAKIFPQSEPKLVSDQNLSILARQLAIHANLASLVVVSLNNQLSDPYASNWLERLRKIKNIRNKIFQEHKNEESLFPGEDIYKNKKHMEDFTDYT